MNTGTEVPVIDLAHLEGFTDGNPELERELAALYLSTAEGYLAELEAALGTGHDGRKVAHSLKGASSNLGAHRVAALALAAENAGVEPEVLAEIRQELATVHRFFTVRGTA